MGKKKSFILIAEDDEDDFLLTQDALNSPGFPCDIQRVPDGEELLSFLLKKGHQTPDLILLDLNMPRKDGREALKDIKADKHLKTIPVVVLTTSKDEEDVLASYSLGANSYIRKSSNFDEFVESLKSLKQYWLHTVQLPTDF